MSNSQELAYFEDSGPIPEPPPYLEQRAPARQNRQYTNREPQGRPQRQNAIVSADLPPVEFDEHGNWAMHTPEQEVAVIRRLRGAGALPDSFETDLQIAFAVQALKAGGMNVYASIGHVAFIYGRYTEFDDVPLAKVLRTGLMEHHDEWGFTLKEDGGYLRMDFENGNLHLPAAGAVCEIKRQGRPLRKFAYTAEQARRNGSANKKGAWSQDPLVMMIRKARSRAFNKEFADILYGDPNADPSQDRRVDDSVLGV